MKATRIVKISLLSLTGLIVILIAAVAFIWKGEIASLRTLISANGNEYLYYMEYKADYDLDDVIEHNVASNKDLLNYIMGRIGKGLPLKMSSTKVVPENEQGVFNCTSFQVRNAIGDGWLYGRNYDFNKNPTLVTLSHPKKGYASIATSDMSHFGFGLDKIPDSFISKLSCLAAIYAPMDGINEKGLCTSIMAIPNQPAQQDTHEHKIGTSILMRLFLDRCATVDQAIELVNSYDVCHDVSVASGYHYMVADAQGNCAVIEFDKDDNWKTFIVRKDADSTRMVVTNHLLSPKFYTEIPDKSVGNVNSLSWWRYEHVNNYLQERDNKVTMHDAQVCLYQVLWKDLLCDDGFLEDTQYSNVYDQSALKLYLRNWNAFSHTYIFSLK